MRSTQKKVLADPLRNRLAFLSLGPNGTYYARGFETMEHPWASTWEGGERLAYPHISYELPGSLTSDTGMVERLTEQRTQVWLGRHGSWVVHWKEDIRQDIYWDVKWHLNDVGLYPGLERFLRTYKTVWQEIKNHPKGARGKKNRGWVRLMVSFYPLACFIPASGKSLGCQRALAIWQHNDFQWLHLLTHS